MQNSLRTLIDRLDQIDETIFDVVSKVGSNISDFLSQVQVNPKLPTFGTGAPLGFVPYPGSKEAAYNRFWNSDVCPLGHCKEYNRTHGVSFWASQLGGDTITKIDQNGPTMLIKLPADYDAQIAARKSNIWDRCQVYIKQ